MSATGRSGRPAVADNRCSSRSIQVVYPSSAADALSPARIPRPIARRASSSGAAGAASDPIAPSVATRLPYIQSRDLWLLAFRAEGIQHGEPDRALSLLEVTGVCLEDCRIRQIA